MTEILGLSPGSFVWIVAGVFLLAYELFAVRFPDRADVLTRAARTYTPRWTFVPVGVGILCGHLFGPRAGAPGWLAVVWIVALAGALARDLIQRTRVAPTAVIGLFLLGVGLGSVFWEGSP